MKGKFGRGRSFFPVPGILGCSCWSRQHWEEEELGKRPGHNKQGERLPCGTWGIEESAGPGLEKGVYFWRIF